MDIEKTEKAVFDLCQKIDKYAHKLEIEDLQKDRYCCLIPNLSMDAVKEVLKHKAKNYQRQYKEQNQVFLHTGPHHDDIMLGIFPCIIPQLRVASNRFHFTVCTSGFTAVTNDMLQNFLQKL